MKLVQIGDRYWLVKSNQNHDPKSGRFAFGRTPQMRAKKRGLRALYGFTLKNPLAAPDSMLVHLTADDLRVAMAKGPATVCDDGSVVVRGRRLERDTGSRRGWGMVKVIWKHGAMSGKARADQVTRADVLALPEVIRSNPSDMSHNGRKIEWRRVRHDGRIVAYAVSQFDGESHSHVVSIHLSGEAEIRKGATRIPLRTGCSSKQGIPEGVLTIAAPSVESLISKCTGKPAPVKRRVLVFIPQQSGFVNKESPDKSARFPGHILGALQTQSGLTSLTIAQLRDAVNRVDRPGWKWLKKSDPSLVKALPRILLTPRVFVWQGARP